VVLKHRDSPYDPDATTWWKVKHATYSQAHEKRDEARPRVAHRRPFAKPLSTSSAGSALRAGSTTTSV
jgi:hypothetical protein